MISGRPHRDPRPERRRSSQMVREGNSGRDAGGQRGHQGGGEGQRDGKYFNNRSLVDFLTALKECVKN